jgi:hypothetical protein
MAGQGASFAHAHSCRADGPTVGSPYATPLIHRDHHIEVAKVLYTIPGNLIGQRVDAGRADGIMWS